MPPSRSSGPHRPLMPAGFGGGWPRAPSGSRTAPRPTSPTTSRPARSALLEVFVDPLAVRAYWRARLGRACDREHLTAQRHHVRAHHGTLGDPVLLDVMK